MECSGWEKLLAASFWLLAENKKPPDGVAAVGFWIKKTLECSGWEKLLAVSFWLLAENKKTTRMGWRLLGFGLKNFGVFRLGKAASCWLLAGNKKATQAGDSLLPFAKSQMAKGPIAAVF
ncbi:MAG TPA: hypothetical protein VJW20_22835 [Candidatus Angelobacter sp.]|nr:hypothetical protein [Candidatus Angelobacter sp.]